MRKIVYPKNGKPNKFGYAVSMNTHAGYRQYCVEDFKSAALPRVYTPLVVCVGDSLESSISLIDKLMEIDESMPVGWKTLYKQNAYTGWKKYNNFIQVATNA